AIQAGGIFGRRAQSFSGARVGRVLAREFRRAENLAGVWGVARQGGGRNRRHPFSACSGSALDRAAYIARDFRTATGGNHSSLCSERASAARCGASCGTCARQSGATRRDLHNGFAVPGGANSPVVDESSRQSGQISNIIGSSREVDLRENTPLV